ncbi:MAG: 50S ribosome-binding GTPase [Chloroflexi bacterium]|nr:50S ribosome-binding GTPase [Chloroflexota bacterium]
MSEGGPLDERLARLRDAVEAARSIGLEPEAAAARTVTRRVGRRAGFGGELYVMALAGGTGVGKSSVLNALAGETVSEVRAVRPTTDRPLAWVGGTRRDEVAPLLEWLKVEQVVTHDRPDLGDIAVLDLPDIDSVRGEHRALVDTLLPRIDAVTWIVDPEKYDDERVHAYWRTLALHADRLRFVLNKSDRLTEEEAHLVADDLRARLVADGIPRPALHVVSAIRGDGIDRLRSDLAEAAHAKVIVSAKLEADRAEAAKELAASVGIEPEDGYQPLLRHDRREALVREAIAGAMTLVDPDGVGRQVRAQVLHRARMGGGSFVGRVTQLGWRLIGGQRRNADPSAYLLAWRTRGALGRVLNPVRAALVEAAAAVPAESRGRILDALGAPSAERDLDAVLDRATQAEASGLEPPESLVWPVLGAAQVVAGALVLFAVAWLVTLFVAGGSIPVDSVGVPILGPIPMPLAVLVGGLLLGALLTWLLQLHAGYVGRSMAREIEERTADTVRAAVVTDGLAGLERVEAARRTIAAALD